MKYLEENKPREKKWNFLGIKRTYKPTPTPTSTPRHLLYRLSYILTESHFSKAWSFLVDTFWHFLDIHFKLCFNFLIIRYWYTQDAVSKPYCFSVERINQLGDPNNIYYVFIFFKLITFPNFCSIMNF